MELLKDIDAARASATIPALISPEITPKINVAGKLLKQLPGLHIDLREQADCIRKEAKMQRCACTQNLGRLSGFPRVARGPPEKIVRLCVVWIDHSVCKASHHAQSDSALVWK